MSYYSVELVVFALFGLAVVFSKDYALSLGGGDGGVDAAFFYPVSFASLLHLVVVSAQKEGAVVLQLHLCMFQLCFAMWWVYLFLYASALMQSVYATLFLPTFFPVTSGVSLAFLTIYVLLMGGAVAPSMWKHGYWAHGCLLGVNLCQWAVLVQASAPCDPSSNPVPSSPFNGLSMAIFLCSALASVPLLLSRVWPWVYLFALLLETVAIVFSVYLGYTTPNSVSWVIWVSLGVPLVAVCFYYPTPAPPEVVPAAVVPDKAADSVLMPPTAPSAPPSQSGNAGMPPVNSALASYAARSGMTPGSLLLSRVTIPHHHKTKAV